MKIGRKASPKVIIRMDGGICSQVAFAALGLELQSRGETVCYDLRWYRECGMDNEGRQVRNYDLPKAFPGLSFPEAEANLVSEYRRHHKRHTDDVAKFKAPLYIGGYPERLPSVFKFRDVFRERFKPELNAEDLQVRERILAGPSCAIHVRRGDLAAGTETAYGRPCDVGYFLCAVKIVSALQPGTRFFFFSDGMDWVESEVIPKLPDGTFFELVRNGSDRGYIDLYQIAQCDAVIASKGSLGWFAAVLSEKKLTALVMPRYNKVVCANMENVIVLNCDRPIPSEGQPPEPVRRRGLWALPLFRVLKRGE